MCFVIMNVNHFIDEAPRIVSRMSLCREAGCSTQILENTIEGFLTLITCRTGIEERDVKT